ncbi:hypothetical protein NEPAR06_1986 [Nematocida parisii]|uniref:Uncharacterized protein n=1 Tax=Nematocida parisii (strain ERTm3) TaxID=935791 RepID=I3EG40_NEMP3|nr:hypothetical protein NEQG_01631 [Nematocida parisii ERTm3]KAI5155605.1 hypothetical protein NEPAR06_1986 [Nematocida parisii]KAI5158921.1 hypothetical protein NEPAR05_2268 [Nematocida parisii]
MVRIVERKKCLLLAIPMILGAMINPMINYTSSIVQTDIPVATYQPMKFPDVYMAKNNEDPYSNHSGYSGYKDKYEDKNTFIPIDSVENDMSNSNSYVIYNTILDEYLQYGNVYAHLESMNKHEVYKRLLDSLQEDFFGPDTIYGNSINNENSKKVLSHLLLSNLSPIESMAIKKIMSGGPENLYNPIEYNKSTFSSGANSSIFNNIITREVQTRSILSEFDSSLLEVFNELFAINSRFVVDRGTIETINKYASAVRTTYAYLSKQLLLALDSCKTQNVYSAESLQKIMLFSIEYLSDFGENITDSGISSDDDLHLTISDYVFKNIQEFSKDINNAYYFQATVINTILQIKELLPFIASSMDVLKLTEKTKDQIATIEYAEKSIQEGLNKAFDELFLFNPYFFDVKYVERINIYLQTSINKLLFGINIISVLLQKNIETLEVCLNEILDKADAYSADNKIELNMLNYSDKKFIQEIRRSSRIINRIEEQINGLKESLLNSQDSKTISSLIFKQEEDMDEWIDILYCKYKTCIDEDADEYEDEFRSGIEFSKTSNNSSKVKIGSNEARSDFVSKSQRFYLKYLKPILYIPISIIIYIHAEIIQ